MPTTDDLVRRLADGKRRARGEFEPWWCSDGHEVDVPVGATAAWCHCSKVLKCKRLYPSHGRRREQA